MTRYLRMAALLAAPALFWAASAQAGVCKNNWGDITPGGQSSEAACKAIGGRWEAAHKIEEPTTGRQLFSHEVKEPNSGRQLFAAPPRTDGTPEGDASRATASSQLEKPDTYAAPDKQRVAKAAGEEPASEETKEEPGAEERPDR